jgi:hypothetical protein
MYNPWRCHQLKPDERVEIGCLDALVTAECDKPSFQLQVEDWDQTYRSVALKPGNLPGQIDTRLLLP